MNLLKLDITREYLKLFHKNQSKQKRTYTKPVMNEEYKEINQTISKNLKRLRKKYNLTQSQIGSYEKGTNRIPASSLFVIEVKEF